MERTMSAHSYPFGTPRAHFNEVGWFLPGAWSTATSEIKG